MNHDCLCAAFTFQSRESVPLWSLPTILQILAHCSPLTNSAFLFCWYWSSQSTCRVARWGHGCFYFLPPRPILLPPSPSGPISPPSFTPSPPSSFLLPLPSPSPLSLLSQPLLSPFLPSLSPSSLSLSLPSLPAFSPLPPFFPSFH